MNTSHVSSLNNICIGPSVVTEIKRNEECISQPLRVVRFNNAESSEQQATEPNLSVKTDIAWFFER